MLSRVFSRAAVATPFALVPAVTALSDDLREMLLDETTPGPLSIVMNCGRAVEKASGNGSDLRSPQWRGSTKAIYTYSAPKWTALVTREDTGIAEDAELEDKRAAVLLDFRLGRISEVGANTLRRPRDHETDVFIVLRRRVRARLDGRRARSTPHVDVAADANVRPLQAVVRGLETT